MTTPDFADRCTLRRLLLDLCTDPARSWSTDPEAAALMDFCAAKYAALAHAYGQSPHDAAVAAFFELRRPRLLEKDDPWGFVTASVEAYLRASERGDELLVGERAARHRQSPDVHEARRLDATAWAVIPDAPSPASPATHHPYTCATPVGQVPPEEVEWAVRAVVWMLTAAGWPPDPAGIAVDYVIDRLMTSGSRSRAHAYLRRDRHALVLLDVAPSRWRALLTAILGTPSASGDTPVARQGVLLRLVLGEPAWDLLHDDNLHRLLVASAPEPVPLVRHTSEGVVSRV